MTNPVGESEFIKMSEVKAIILPLHSASYDDILEIVYQNLPEHSEEKSNFIDSIHQLYFNNQFEGNILKIENQICGFLIFSFLNPKKIEVMISRTDIKQETIIGLLLNYHTKKFNLIPEKLEFRIWSHQTDLLTFLHHLK